MTRALWSTLVTSSIMGNTPILDVEALQLKYIDHTFTYNSLLVLLWANPACRAKLFGEPFEFPPQAWAQIGPVLYMAPGLYGRCP